MNRTSQQTEQIRLSLLRYCNSAAQYGLATPLLVQLLRSEGFGGLDTDETRAELLYLADKGLVASVSKLVSPENEGWRITAAGRDFTAQHEQGKI